jgi:hypothetical protein
MKTPRPGPGRPRKYGRPSHAVTITLPEDVLIRLRSLDVDLGRAIVTLVERQSTSRSHVFAPAEIAPYGNHAVIVVDQMKALKRLPGVQLVPTGNGRALISLDQPNSIPRLELNVRDAIDSDITDKERQTLEALAAILRNARSSRGVSLKERSIIVLESRRQHWAS